MSVSLVKYKLHEIAELVRGVTFKKSDSQNIHSNGCLPVIRAGNIQNKLILNQKLVWVPKIKIKQNQTIIKNDIIMCTSSGSASLVGKCAMAESNWNGSFGAFCLGIRPITSRCSPSYLLHYLHSPIFTNWSQNSSGANIKNIRKSEIENFSILLPPLPVQQKIATILDTADALKQKDKALIAKYDELCQSLFLDMFGDPVINPKSWETVLLEETCEKIYGGGTPSKKIPEYYIGNIPWVTPKDMKSEYISKSIDYINNNAVDNSSAKLIPPHSVLMVIRSGILKHTLPLAINNCEITINQDMKAYLPDKKITNPYYLLHFFKGVEQYLLGKVRAVTADNIEFRQIKKLSFPKPPIDLQNQFAERIQTIEQQKQQAQASLKKSEDLFNCLLQKAFKDELVT